MAAIIGMGPSFIMTFIVKRSQTITELRHAFYLRSKIHLFIMVGGTLLLITGLWMGYLNPVLFQHGWYVISILLYGITLAAGPILLGPSLKPIKELLANYQGEDIPETYNELAKRLYFFENITNILILTIIVLMILKPF